MHRWGYSDSPFCDCGFAQQTTTHIFDIPERPFKGGLKNHKNAKDHIIAKGQMTAKGHFIDNGHNHKR
jgi:hypothetical protein